MKKFIIAGTFCAVALLGGGQAAFAEETTTTTTTSRAEMLAKIQDLMKLITDLQTKLSEARGEIKDLVADLKIGATGDDVKEIQEILATDPTIFGVKPTGYYGPLTEAAIIKFQARYGLTETGIVDEATREVMRELKMEKKNGMIPPGLVKSDEVKDRIKARLQDKWGDCVWGPKFRASDCLKDKDKDDDEDDDDNASSTDATRADALAAIEEAKEAVAALVDEIEEMEDADADEDDIEDAEDRLMDARKKLAEARRALVRGDYDNAVDKAEDAKEEAEDEDEDEDDEDDDDDDDEDDDDDDDEDDDEDDE